jgi:perosamine synthetase
MRIPLSSPDISERDIEAVVSVLRTPQLSLGPKLFAFEGAFARYIGVPHGIALSSGTAGLHLGLQALGIQEGDEVILPSFTFIAAANAVRYLRAVPVFAEINPVTLNLDPASVERAVTCKTRAVIVVHTFGYPADLDPILRIAEKHNLRVIEDACEAVGAEYRGQRVGGIGDLGVFSFYPNKPITTGEGGVAVTRDGDVARTIRALRNQGRMENDGWLEHTLLGSNYRLPEISCALGISQLERIEAILARREAVARSYAAGLSVYPEIEIPPLSAPNGRICWFAFIVRLPSGCRDRVMEVLTEKGIGCRAYFPPIHLQPLYSPYARGPLPVSENIASRTLALPFFNALTEDAIAEVCGTLGETVKQISGEA